MLIALGSEGGNLTEAFSEMEDIGLGNYLATRGRRKL